MDFGGKENRINYSESLKKKQATTTNGDNLAIVPSANSGRPNPSVTITDVHNSTTMSSHKPVNFNQYPMAVMSDSTNASFSLHDVNSTTNLLGMDSANITPCESTSNFMTLDGGGGGGKVYNDRLATSSTTLLTPNGQQLLNNSESQSSMETTMTTTRLKLDDDVDLIPLMPLNNHQTSIPVNDGHDLEKESMKQHLASEEKWYIVLLQILFPFFIAGFGMVGAGVVLDITQHWTLFKEVPAIFTLIPALLGLKGNLEMTLASRFSTQVNLGKIRDKSTILSAVLGNIALTQAQAIIVGFLASIGAIILKAISEKKFELDKALVLVAGSVSTASFASLILAGLMMFVILLSKKFRINPDNVATPLAASLGDLVTLSILSVLCTILYTIRSMIAIPIIITVLFVIMVPIFIFYSCKNDFVKEALHHGWVPIILAMVISSTGGVIMGLAVHDYSDIAVFQPVVNGVGGNLVAIFASRLSTALHKTGRQGTQAFWAPRKWYLYPIQTFYSKSNPEAKTAAILAFLAIPGHTIFFFTIEQIKKIQNDPMNEATLSSAFISFYLGISTLQVLILLLVCYWMVHLAWRLNTNPDNVCIPYLTAIGDLLGMFFLAICFHVLYLSGLTGLKRPS